VNEVAAGTQTFKCKNKYSPSGTRSIGPVVSSHHDTLSLGLATRALTRGFRHVLVELHMHSHVGFVRCWSSYICTHTWVSSGAGRVTHALTRGFRQVLVELHVHSHVSFVRCWSSYTCTHTWDSSGAGRVAYALTRGFRQVLVNLQMYAHVGFVRCWSSYQCTHAWVSSDAVSFLNSRHEALFHGCMNK
jgi:hypothetical protein